MNNFKVEIREHPSRKLVLDPTTGQPMLDDAGKPLRYGHITDTQAVYVQGRLVAYCGTKPGMPLNFIGNFPPVFVGQVKTKVEEMLGSVSKTSVPPRLPKKNEATE